MRLSEIQDQVKRDTQAFFPPTDNPEEAILYLTVALAGEVGEFANFVKKQHRGTPVAFNDMVSELPDILIYLLMVAEQMGIDLEYEYHEKRKYNVSRFTETER